MKALMFSFSLLVETVFTDYPARETAKAFQAEALRDQ
jgi:hypothetical protein